MSNDDVNKDSYKRQLACGLTSVHRFLSSWKVLLTDFAVCCGFFKVGRVLGKEFKGI